VLETILLVTSKSTWKYVFKSTLVQVGFMVDKLALRQDFRAFSWSYSVIIIVTKSLYSRVYLSHVSRDHSM